MITLPPLRSTLTLLLFALLAGCELIAPDEFGGDREAVTFGTDGTDIPWFVHPLPDGTLLVGGMGAGVIAPLDGTLPYPSLYRLDRDGGIAWGFVYRGLEYAESRAALPYGGGTLLLVALPYGPEAYRGDEGPAMALWDVAPGGALRRQILLRTDASVPYAATAPLVPLRDGGYALLLRTEDHEGVVVKLDASFRTVWTASTPRSEWNAVVERADGDLVVAGNGIVAEDTERVLLWRLAPDGAQRWLRTYEAEEGGERAYALVPTAAGYALVGEAFRSGELKGLLLRVDDEGTLAGRVRFGDAYTSPASATATPDGGVFVVGTTWMENEPSEALAARFESDGAMRWLHTYGDEDTIEGFTAVAAQADGTFVLAGYMGPNRATYGGPDHDVYVVIVSPDGAFHERFAAVAHGR